MLPIYRLRTRSTPFSAISASVLLVLLTASAFADNAALTSGGVPKMLSAHSSITMVSEVVKVSVHGTVVHTDCTFDFRNDGPACVVKMGFPDFGLWAYAQKTNTASTMFKRFESYVDGKQVSTRLELGNDPGEQWRTKFVSFAAGENRTVREVYSTDLGGIATGIVLGAASYVLRTGSSWHGPIGKATIIVDFEPDSEMALPLQISDFNSLSSLKPENLDKLFKPGVLVGKGPSKPTVRGNSIVFERSNWKPTEKDDILVLFRFPPKVLEQLKKKAKGGG